MDTNYKALEYRVRELERALDIERMHNNEAQKQLYKRDRKIRELTIEAEEYKEKFESVQNSVKELENDLRIYKRRLEDTQEISSHNQSKLKKINQKYLDEVGKMEEIAEQRRRKRAELQNTPFFFQV